MNCLEGFQGWIWAVGVEGASPGRWELDEWVCACGREVQKGDLTTDGNLGKGMPAFWVLENRGGKGSAEVWLPSFLCPLMKGVVWESL